MKYNTGALEWFGHISTTDSVRLGLQLAYSTTQSADKKRIKDLVSNNGTGATMEILDISRIEASLTHILEEESLHKLKMDKERKEREEKLKSYMEGSEDDEEELEEEEEGDVNTYILNEENNPKGTLFHESGASIEVYQTRNAPAYVTEGKFCEDRVGKWKSLQVRGKHSQHFVFERNLKEEGIKLQKKRKRTQVVR
jgi:hypothetical protein